MEESRTRKAQKLLREALSYPAEERDAFFVKATAGDAALLAEARMLHDHWRSSDPLTLPTAGAEVQIPGGLPIEGPGTRIGPYTLIENLGEGGFGVVFLAQQDEPVRRRVALKIIKLGMDTRAVIARFEAERQALAIMDHPGIAKVLDAGATSTGRPYFVMELVRGIPITKYADLHELTLRERLELFVETCRAVQHAHQKGVIHRDLKPGNILVTDVDGRPAPKIIDFGVAKATHARLTEKTLFTELRQIVGTPEYMSPEQADLGAEDIDTRADIYSLGVVLYELLTGMAPFEPSRLRSAAYAEIQRIIREEEPPTPSTRLSSMHQSAGGANGASKSRTRRLGEQLRGELDWIVMKSLEKDRGRRYDSAAAFASDIEKHLLNEPIEAAPPTAWYRGTKFMRRHRVGVAVAAAFALLLLSGSAAVGWLGVRAMRAESLAVDRQLALEVALAESDHLRGEAEIALRRQEGVHTFFIERLLRSARPNESRGRDMTVLELVDIAAPRADDIPDPIVQAAVRDEIASVYAARGRTEDAMYQWERALTLLNADPAHLSQARSAILRNLAKVQLGAGDYEAMLASIDASESEDAGGLDPVERGQALNLRAIASRLRGDFDTALAAADQGLRLLHDGELNRRVTLTRSDLYRTRASVLASLDRKSEAVEATRLAVENAAQWGDSTFHAESLLQHGVALARGGRPLEGVETCKAGLAMYLIFMRPTDRVIANARHALAIAYFEAGMFDESAALSQKAIQSYEVSGTAAQPAVAPLLMQRSRAHRVRGRLDEAAMDLNRAIRVLAAAPAFPGGGLAMYRTEYAKVLALEERIPEAMEQIELARAEEGLSSQAAALVERTAQAIENGRVAEFTMAGGDISQPLP